MVTSLKMRENKMDNRGSKSAAYLVLIILLVFAYFIILFISTLSIHFDESPFSSSILLASSVIPVKIYKNADLDKLQVIKEAKGKSGIYR
jgi:small neutral amino acid transporter SnatA (MarC family)